MSEEHMISCQVDADFLNLFTHNKVDEEIWKGNPSLFNLFTLKVENNSFIYNELIKDLDERIITFCTPRKRYEELIKKGKIGKLSKEARKKLRKHTENKWEAWELLLYCFLESHLNSPKLLSKFDIKTSNNDYVKWADGVHILEINKTKYQIVFWEAKLEATLTRSLYSAFKSINNFIKRRDNSAFYETQLIIWELEKECTNEEQYEFIKSILVPQKNTKTIKDNAFWIFAGFDIQLTEEEKKLSNDDFRKLIDEKVLNEYNGKIKYIEEKIDEYELWWYTFYVYVVPFIELAARREYIIAELKDIAGDE